MKTNPWHENSKKNLLPLSMEKENFAEALKEWEFTGECADNNDSEGICELCEHEKLRYHFQIKNPESNNVLWVGSSCIEKFDITVYDEFGFEIEKEKKGSYLKKYIKNKYVKKSLQQLLSSKKKEELLDGRKKADLDDYCLDSFEMTEKIDAKMLNYLFLRFEEEGIMFNAEFFSVDIKSHDNKDKLLKLKMHQYERIKKSLSQSQRDMYEKNSSYFSKNPKDNGSNGIE